MAEPTYGGESVGKKIARFNFWHRAQLWHRGAFTSLRHLVLASRECGDASVLRAMGVPVRNIIAVDIDQEALDACRDRFPGITALHGDVDEVLADQSCLGTVFLDFCGWATDAQIASVAKACAAVVDHGIVGHGFMRGREQGASRHAIERERFASRASSRELLEALGLHQESDGRHGWVLERLQSATEKQRVGTYLLWMLRYHSTCSWRNGVPMMIVARQVERFCRCTGRDEFIRRRNKMGRDWSVALQKLQMREWQQCQDVGLDPRKANGHQLIAELSGGRGYAGRRLSIPYAKLFEGRDVLSLANLVHSASVADELFPGKAHELLNIRKQRLAALRAHATRGSYAA